MCNICSFLLYWWFLRSAVMSIEEAGWSPLWSLLMPRCSKKFISSVGYRKKGFFSTKKFQGESGIRTNRFSCLKTFHV